MEGKARPGREVSLSSLWLGWILGVFLLLCLLYFFAFATDLSTYETTKGFFQQSLNLHDHQVYRSRVDDIFYGEVGYELSNDLGIAALYAALASAVPALADNQYAVLALLLNCLVLVISAWLYARICTNLALGTLAKLTFFANLQFLYFAQLINKDMLTVFLFLLALHLALRGRLAAILLLLPVAVLVRQQLALCLGMFFVLMTTSRPILAATTMYVVTSLAAGALSVFLPVIGQESLEEGLSAFLVGFNEAYFYSGYLLFNPVRVVQYVFDAYSSFYFLSGDDGIDMARVLRLPQLVLLLFIWLPIVAAIPLRRCWTRGPDKAFVMMTASYLMAWLMNPTVNARYVMLYAPVMVLYGLYLRYDPAQQQPA